MKYKYPIVVAIINWVFIFFVADLQLLEQKYGLSHFYRARDWLLAPSPPDDIIDIEIDQSTFLEIPTIRQCLQKYRGAIDSRCFSRRLHGDLVRALHQQGVKLIVFNLLFREGRGNEDEYFANAIRQAGNVLLQDYQEKRFIGGVEIIDVTPPVSPLAESTVSAPMAIADGFGPASPLWLFVNLIQTEADNARNVSRPVLPLLAAHALILQDDLDELSSILRELSPALPGVIDSQTKDGYFKRLNTFVEEMNQNLIANLNWKPIIDRHPEWESSAKRRLLALFDWHQEERSFFLNPYGPYRTLSTVPYQKVMRQLLDQPDSFRNKIVIIGPSMEWGRSAKGGVVETAYGPISSTELVATMLANLRDGMALKAVSPLDALMLAWSAWLMIAFIQLRFSSRRALFLLAGLSFFYLLGVWLSFCLQQRLLPGSAIVFQACVAMMAIALQQYLVQREKLSVMLQASLPPQLMKLFSGQDFETMKQGIPVWGVCLATDGAGYTRLAEIKGERWLAEFMLAYQPMIERCVKKHQGIVKDWAGDGMIALWIEDQAERLQNDRSVPGQSSNERQLALQAALTLIEETERFNQIQGVQFPLRIGLSYGPLWLSFSDELKVFGDTLNTASRLEALNKETQTSVLFTQHFLPVDARFLTRALGSFLLRGHQQPIEVFELMGLQATTDPRLQQLCLLFESALARYVKEETVDAADCFERILQDYPDDGPSLYYYQQCLSLMNSN